MKSKLTTYLLGAVVAIVWGLIIYRIIGASTGDDDTPAPVTTVSMSKEPLNDYAMVKDTSKLLLNYRDPFAIEKQKDTVKEIPLRQLMRPVIKPASVMAAPVVQPAINWNFITYTGFIRNPSSKKLLALVHINGKEILMSEGETADDVTLLRNMHDSIKVAYQGKTKFIVMNNTTL